MKNLQIFLDALEKIPKKSKAQLFPLITKIKLKKGDCLSKAGKNPTNLYIIEFGIARSFFSDKKGKEHNRNIFTSGTPLGALGALILNKPSRFSYDCLSDCSFYVLNFKSIKKLIKKDSVIANLYTKILENVFLELEAKVYDLSILNATERYLKLKRQSPEIEDLIPQYHIASFLNITPVQLSRIRRDLNTNKKKLTTIN